MMIKNIFLLLFISVNPYLHAQTLTATQTDLELLQTPEQVTTYLESKKSKNNKIVTFNQEIHKSVLAKELFELPKGGLKSVENEFDYTHYKILDRFENTYYRVSFIALDTNNLTEDEINLLQGKIIRQFESNIPFKVLAKKYSTNQNAKFGGDTGWFLEDEMNDDFKKHIINDKHALNDIFTLFIPATNEYFIVLKTYKPKVISELKVLKIVDPKS